MHTDIAQASPASPVYRPIRQIRRCKGLHKLLYNRLGLSLEMSEAAIRKLKQAWNPGQVTLRMRVASELRRSKDDERLQRDGYLKLDTSNLDALPNALNACTKALDGLKASGQIDAVRVAGRKHFLVSVIKNEEAFRHQGLMELAVSRPLVELASRYLGSVPLLSGLRLWWTPPNRSKIESQLFHCDREDRTQLKFLINVTPTDTKNGPITLISAQQSERIKSSLGYHYRNNRLTDEEVLDAGKPDRPVRLTGPRGSAYCVDTSRCLHYGSRGNVEPRLVLMIQYTRYLAPNVSLPLWVPEAGIHVPEFDALQCLALGLAED